EAIAVYRENFRPSEQLQKPYVMVGVNTIVAETDKEARYLFTSIQQSFANMRRGQRMKFQPPIQDMSTYWSYEEKLMATHMLSYSYVGTPDKVKMGLQELVKLTRADEL